MYPSFPSRSTLSVAVNFPPAFEIVREGGEGGGEEEKKKKKNLNSSSWTLDP
jgi:hypothetical protein